MGKEIKKSGWKIVFKLLRVTVGTLTVLLALLAILLTLAGGTLIYWNWYLPDKLTGSLLPPYLKPLGLERLEISIRRIGFAGADLAGLTLTDAQGQKMSVDSVRIDYQLYFPWTNPKVLDIKNITVSGTKIAIRSNNGAFTIDGLDLEKLQLGLADLSKPTTPSGPKESRKLLPLVGNATGPMVVLRQVTLKSAVVSFDLGGKQLQLPIDVTLTSQDNAWQVINAQLLLTPCGQKIHLGASIDLKEKSVKVNGSTKLQLTAFPDWLNTCLPGQADLKFDTALALIGGEIRSAGELESSLDFSAGALPVNFDRPIEIKQKFNVRYNIEKRNLQIELTGSSPLSPFSLDQGAIGVKALDPVEWNLRLSQSVEGWKIEKASLVSGNLKAAAHGFNITVPQLSLTGDNNALLITAGGISAVNPGKKLVVTDIQLSMPLLPTEKTPADLKIGKILYDNHEAGSLTASLSIKNRGLALTGRLETKLLDGAYADFRGSLSPRPGELPDALFEVTVPPYTPKQPINLGEYLPSLNGAMVNGIVSLGGAARLENGKFSTGMQLFLYDGQFELPESGLKAEGIKLDIHFNDLINLNTPAGQRLSVKNLEFGNLKLQNVDLRFNIQSWNQAFVESLRSDWCGGNISLNFLELRRDRKVWETELYCENLELCKLISQLKLASADGAGALYGKIPLRLSPSGIQIGQSFLYTRPGAANTIRIVEPEKMVNGMAGALAQQSQFDFALEALKDFTYSWAKINLAMQKDSLGVSLQFDGHPNQLLPFVYEEESGQFRRDPAAKARFQGITLNINTSIPINYLLKLNEKLKNLSEGKK